MHHVLVGGRLWLFMAIACAIPIGVELLNTLILYALWASPFIFTRDAIGIIRSAINPCIVPALGSVGFAVAVMVDRSARRKARADWRHVVRSLAYSCSILPLLFVPLSVFVLWVYFSMHQNAPRATPTHVDFICAPRWFVSSVVYWDYSYGMLRYWPPLFGCLWVSVWWWLALRRGLMLPGAIIAFAAGAVISLLGVAVYMVYLGGMLQWLVAY